MLRKTIFSTNASLFHVIMFSTVASSDVIPFYSTQVKVNGPVHARSKHTRYMHNDAQVKTGPLIKRACCDRLFGSLLIHHLINIYISVGFVPCGIIVLTDPLFNTLKTI